MEEKKILLVEDEVDILNLLKFNFQNEGFAIYTAQDGDQALELAKKHLPHLIVLDLMLPGKDGLEVAKILKKKSETKEIPIIMLTAKGEEEDRVSGFELGADDYVVKPFSPRELLLRVWAVLKRTKNLAPKEDTWEKEGLRIEFETYRVLINTQEIDLTATEFQLLSSLVRAEGRVLSREQLLDLVWGYEFFGYARTVDTHMHRLRQKLGPFAEWIQTVRGIGYRLRKR